jgi:trk system potassium uptake protein TrkH
VSVRARARRTRSVQRLAVDITGVLNLVGTLVGFLSPSVLVPSAIAVGYGEPVWPFLAAGALAAAFGFGLARLTAGAHAVGMREGYLVVSLTWLLVALFGALPYLFSGNAQLDRPVDALFESMSGFTTTGSSIVTDVEALPQSLLMWRALTQWLGGMGIIVLVLAVLPRLRVGGRQLLESEMPGPEMATLGERIRQTAQRLWLVYVGITALEALLLATLGWTGIDDRMDLFKAVAHALTTLPSGGFSTEARSIETFSAATQWVVAFFMLVAGTNFALTYRALVRRNPRIYPRDEEFRLYLALVALAAAVLTVELWTEGVLRGEAAVRAGVFQTLTMMTSTGYSSADFNLWPVLALMVLVGLLFIGGSAGSTSGSVKVIRHLLQGKMLRRELRQTVHPEVVGPIRFNGIVVEERTLRAVAGFILLYVGVFIAGALLIALDAARTDLALAPLDVVACVATTLANTGPGLGIAGPLGSFEPFSDLSKLVFIVVMWIGRIEVIPIVVLFTRHYWRV